MAFRLFRVSFALSLAVLALVIALVGSRTLQARGPAQRSETRPNTGEAKRQLSEYRTDGLLAAARVTGTFRLVQALSTAGAPESLEELLDLSDLVVTGQVSSNVCLLSPDGFTISTYHSLEVSSIIKGDYVPRAVFAFPGGTYIFPDDTRAQVSVPNLRPPQEGHEILVFLRRAPKSVATPYLRKGSESVWVPVAGGLGVFGIDGDERRGVNPFGGQETALATTLYKQKLSPQQLVSEVRRLQLAASNR
jgi:hypothetical protein